MGWLWRLGSTVSFFLFLCWDLCFTFMYPLLKVLLQLNPVPQEGGLEVSRNNFLYFVWIVGRCRNGGGCVGYCRMEKSWQRSLAFVFKFFYMCARSRNVVCVFVIGCITVRAVWRDAVQFGSLISSFVRLFRAACTFTRWGNDSVWRPHSPTVCLVLSLLGVFFCRTCILK
jgi:hypothetical protein